MTITIPGLPPLSWTGTEGAGSYDQTGTTLTLQASAGVDWTNDAGGGPQQQAATALAFAAPERDFVLSARVRVPGVRSTFDAGALALWSDGDHWAKVCNEFSPQGRPMVVSVVTDGFSDDCNSTELDDSVVFLRIARVGPAFAFHASADGVRWDFVRTFRLEAAARPWSVGFLAQAPTGQSCTATFDTIDFAERSVADLRNHS